MSVVTIASARIVKLSARHDVDPFGVVGLLALHALSEVDFAKLRFWKTVSAALQQKTALPA